MISRALALVIPAGRVVTFCSVAVVLSHELMIAGYKQIMITKIGFVMIKGTA